MAGIEDNFDFQIVGCWLTDRQDKFVALLFVSARLGQAIVMLGDYIPYLNDRGDRGDRTEPSPREE